MASFLDGVDLEAEDKDDHVSDDEHKDDKVRVIVAYVRVCV